MKIAMVALSAGAFALVAGGYTSSLLASPAPMPTGSSYINSGGASGSSEGENKNIPLVDTIPPGGEVIYIAPWGNVEKYAPRPQYEVGQ